MPRKKKTESSPGENAAPDKAADAATPSADEVSSPSVTSVEGTSPEYPIVVHGTGAVSDGPPQNGPQVHPGQAPQLEPFQVEHWGDPEHSGQEHGEVRPDEAVDPAARESQDTKG